MNRHDVYRFIAAEKTSYPVRLPCRLLGVGHSSFYEWQRGGRQRAPVRVEQDASRAATARLARAEHGCVYGARRLITRGQLEPGTRYRSDPVTTADVVPGRHMPMIMRDVLPGGRHLAHHPWRQPIGCRGLSRCRQCAASRTAVWGSGRTARTARQGQSFLARVTSQATSVPPAHQLPWTEAHLHVTLMLTPRTAGPAKSCTSISRHMEMWESRCRGGSAATPAPRPRAGLVCQFVAVVLSVYHM